MQAIILRARIFYGILFIPYETLAANTNVSQAISLANTDDVAFPVDPDRITARRAAHHPIGH
jgi:hypothetical protein